MELGEPDEGDDLATFRTPPAPDDRLWRHPSEMQWPSTSGRSELDRQGWSVIVAAGLVGAIVTVGLLAITGGLDVGGQRDVLVREAVEPTVAGLPGADGVVGLVASVAPAVVGLELVGDDVTTVASGVLFRDDGHLLTNTHVVNGATGIVVVLADGRRLAGRLVGADVDSDIAVVKITTGGPFPIAALGSADGADVGQLAVVVSSPLGLRGQASVTTGVVSALGRQLTRKDGARLLDMIQTDAAISSVASGGALIDGTGTVIGITTDAGTEAGGFATPVDVARAVADDLVAHGRVRGVWVGVRGADAVGGGVVVGEVMTGGPAAAAGLLPGDVIRQIDGRPVISMTTLHLELRRWHPSDQLAVVYERAGEQRTTTLELAERQAT